MELSDLALRDINELSSGEIQKVLIAKAIVQEPKILLLDEPSTYLDLKYQLKIMQLIRKLVDEKQLTAICTTHDLNLALRFSDQIAVLDDGEDNCKRRTEILTEEVIQRGYEVRDSLFKLNGKPFIVP